MAPDDNRLDRFIKGYFRSPCSLAKDVVLFCFAIPGIFSLLKSSLGGHRTMVSFNGQLQTGSTPLGSCNCGDSVAEAREMGCKFDILAAAWLPDRCRDESLTSEFEKAGDGLDGQWTYWLDLNHTQEIAVSSLGGLAEPDFLFYSSSEWHITHCYFYWRKQYRSLFNGVLVEPRYNSEIHINHCGNLFLHPSELGTVSGIALNSDYF